MVLVIIKFCFTLLNTQNQYSWVMMDNLKIHILLGIPISANKGGKKPGCCRRRSGIIPKSVDSRDTFCPNRDRHARFPATTTSSSIPFKPIIGSGCTWVLYTILRILTKSTQNRTSAPSIIRFSSTIATQKKSPLFSCIDCFLLFAFF